MLSTCLVILSNQKVINCGELLTYYQWIHKCESSSTNINPFIPFHCVTIKSNLLLLLLDYSKQQFAINIEQILVQTIIWLLFVDWYYCHLWMFYLWTLDHWLVYDYNDRNVWLIDISILILYHCIMDQNNINIRQEGLILW